jgi:hypothetical protein
VLAPPLPLLLSQLSRNPQVFGIKLNHPLAFEAHASGVPTMASNPNRIISPEIRGIAPKASARQRPVGLPFSYACYSRVVSCSVGLSGSD